MIIIGEKINGSIPSAGKAIAAHDEEYIRTMTRNQDHYGADFIDCCSSVNEGELETMKWMIETIQEETDLPISVDSPDPRICIECMPFCNKPGLINSVSGEGDKCDIVFPAIADTKWGVVALLSDDRGIPTTVEGRLEVLEAIMEKAKKYGIDPSRIYIDALVESVGANEESLPLFNECCAEIKRRYPTIHVTAAVSNISFGLPARKYLNMAFLVLAMQAGLDSAILDPCSRDTNGILHAADALLGEDEYCLEYIDAYREDLFGKQPAK